MTIFNLGSINVDHVYRVPHLPAPGETLSASSHQVGLGGKGANMSIAMARAWRQVVHIGAIGVEGEWARDLLKADGVNTAHIHYGTVTGHAIIQVDQTGENAITIWAGANREVSISAVIAALSQAEVGDTFVMQNETNLQAEAANLAQAKRLRIVYAAAPFDAQAVQAVLPFLDLLVMNTVEAAQLADATGFAPQNLPVADVVVTLGSDGCRWFDNKTNEIHDFPAPQVDPVDTTGAGDTFTGYLVAGLDRGQSMEDAIADALAAAAIMVTRLGTAEAIPKLDEVRA